MATVRIMSRSETVENVRRDTFQRELKSAAPDDSLPRTIAFDKLRRSTIVADDDLVVAETMSGLRMAPKSTDIVREVTSDSVIFTRSHLIHRATGDILESLRDSIGKEVEYAADVSSGDIWAIFDVRIPAPTVVLRYRRYNTLKELEATREKKKPSFPTEKRIRELHAALAKQPHIPFLYVQNGCWARAEAMCQYLTDHLGVASRLVSKIWVHRKEPYRLVVKSNTISSACHVDWAWHVAALVEGRSQYWVLDPALNDRPLSGKDWRARLNVASTKRAFTTYSHWERYAYSDEYDVAGAQKAKTLASELKRFDDLENMQIAQCGSPPYDCNAHCSIPEP